MTEFEEFLLGQSVQPETLGRVLSALLGREACFVDKLEEIMTVPPQMLVVLTGEVEGDVALHVQLFQLRARLPDDFYEAVARELNVPVVVVDDSTEDPACFRRIEGSSWESVSLDLETLDVQARWVFQVSTELQTVHSGRCISNE